MRGKDMIIEVDEVKVQEMEEDLENYVKLIKQYDDAVVVKDELIRRYEKELKSSSQIILVLLKVVKENFKGDTQKLEEIENLMKDLEVDKDGI